MVSLCCLLSLVCCWAVLLIGRTPCHVVTSREEAGSSGKKVRLDAELWRDAMPVGESPLMSGVSSSSVLSPSGAMRPVLSWT